MLEKFIQLTHSYDPLKASMDGGKVVERRLSQLAGCFADEAAFAAAVNADDTLVYRVTAIEPAHDSGDLHYGLGVIYPGKVGQEYFLTKGHLHSTREAAEVYIGLSGEGFMLLEDEQSGESRLERLGAGKVVYVPGHTAHRTMNTSNQPLTYFGIYPANSGHDYGAIAERNFNKVLVDVDGVPTLLNRVKKKLKN